VNENQPENKPQTEGDAGAPDAVSEPKVRKPRKAAVPKVKVAQVASDAPVVQSAQPSDDAPVKVLKPRKPRVAKVVDAPVSDAAEPALKAAPTISQAPLPFTGNEQSVVHDAEPNGNQAPIISQSEPSGNDDAQAGAQNFTDGEPNEHRPRGRNNNRNQRGPRAGQERAQGPRQPGAPRAPIDDSPDPDPVPQFELDAPVGRNAAMHDRNARNSRSKPRPVDDDSSKLHKILADAGLGSRREMEEMIMQGRVSVNGQPAHVGQRLNPTDQVRVNGKPVRRRAVHVPPRVLLYHKPAGEMVTREDPNHRPLVFDRLPRLQGARWVAVGRLDFNTEGLLVVTTSGDLANKLMHPRYGWNREYAVRLMGRLDEQTREKLLTGIELEDGLANFSHVEEIGGDGANCWYKVVLNEGRNREVRRMFESIGIMVSRLCRVRFGPIALPSALKRGRWVELADGDMRLLNEAMRSADPQAAPGAKKRHPNAQADDASTHGEGDDDSMAREVGNQMPDQARQGRQGRPVRQRRGPERGQRPDSNFGNRAPAASPAGFAGDDGDDEDRFNRVDPLEFQPPAAFKEKAINRDTYLDNESDDDFEIPESEWQPPGANAHLEGITRSVRKRAPGLPNLGPGAGGPRGPGQGNKNRRFTGGPNKGPGFGGNAGGFAGGPRQRRGPGPATAFTGPMDSVRPDPLAPLSGDSNRRGRGKRGGRGAEPNGNFVPGTQAGNPNGAARRDGADKPQRRRGPPGPRRDGASQGAANQGPPVQGAGNPNGGGNGGGNRNRNRNRSNGSGGSGRGPNTGGGNTDGGNSGGTPSNQE
jgi:23S rRNA pseudouridine2605 synthase